MDEQKLNEEFRTYRDLANQDKNIDVATLMISALQKERDSMLTSKEKRWAYLVALGVPPFGLIYAVKFYVSDKSDGKQAAWMCIILTFASLLLFWLIYKATVSGTGVGVNQIEQIKPSDIYQLTQ